LFSRINNLAARGVVGLLEEQDIEKHSYLTGNVPLSFNLVNWDIDKRWIGKEGITKLNSLEQNNLFLLCCQ
jgi:hypothetical protein